MIDTTRMNIKMMIRRSKRMMRLMMVREVKIYIDEGLSVKFIIYLRKGRRRGMIEI